MEDRGALCQPRSSLLVQQAAVRDLTGGDGVDIVVETMGPATIEQSIIAAARYSDIVAAHLEGDGPTQSSDSRRCLRPQACVDPSIIRKVD